MVKDISERQSCEGALNAANETDFKKIYDATFNLLFKVSFRIVNDEEAAEDLVHDSYIKANEKAMAFPTMNDATFWLIRVVKNASLNYIKRKGREKKALQREFYEDRRQMASGETDALRAETVEKAKEALKALPDNLREVLVLREYADMNYKEIGKTLGITEGNVKVRVFRAREALSKLIGEDDVSLS
jgi:RNA polymerase sigma-70 factor (ECF subfamily)